MAPPQRQETADGLEAQFQVSLPPHHAVPSDPPAPPDTPRLSRTLQHTPADHAFWNSVSAGAPQPLFSSETRFLQFPPTLSAHKLCTPAGLTGPSQSAPIAE